MRGHLRAVGPAEAGHGARARSQAQGPGEATGRLLTGGLSRWLSILAHRLESLLAQWPLSPWPFWAQPWVWVSWGVLVWVGETVTPPELHLMPLGLVSVLLAAWRGDAWWSLSLAGLLPWGSLFAWYWGNAPWPLWVEVLNNVGYTVAMTVAAVLMTAVQRHAVRLALERDPRLAQQRSQQQPWMAS